MTPTTGHNTCTTTSSTAPMHASKLTNRRSTTSSRKTWRLPRRTLTPNSLSTKPTYVPNSSRRKSTLRTTTSWANGHPAPTTARTPFESMGRPQDWPAPGQPAPTPPQPWSRRMLTWGRQPSLPLNKKVTHLPQLLTHPLLPQRLLPSTLKRPCWGKGLTKCRPRK